MQKVKTLTTYQRLNRRPIRTAWSRLGAALAMLSLAPAPALAIWAAGLAFALAWGGYYLAAAALMPALGLALAIRGAAQGGGWTSPGPRRRMTRLDRAANVLLAVSLAGLVILGLVALLWR